MRNPYQEITSYKRHQNAKLMMEGYQTAQAPNPELMAAAAAKRAKRMERNWALAHRVAEPEVETDLMDVWTL